MQHVPLFLLQTCCFWLSIKHCFLDSKLMHLQILRCLPRVLPYWQPIKVHAEKFYGCTPNAVVLMGSRESSKRSPVAVVDEFIRMNIMQYIYRPMSYYTCAYCMIFVFCKTSSTQNKYYAVYSRLRRSKNMSISHFNLSSPHFKPFIVCILSSAWFADYTERKTKGRF